MSVPGLGPVTVVNLMSDEEKQIAKDAADGRSIDAVFDGLVSEVIAIGQSVEYTVLSEKRTAAYDSKCRHKRVYEIGKLLNDHGGMKTMQAAAYRIRAAGCDGRDLDRCWDGIGEWRQ